MLYDELDSKQPTIKLGGSREIENLRSLGFSELDINKLRLKNIVDNKLGWEALEQEKIAQHQRELQRIEEISNALKNGEIHLDDKVTISAKAWKTEGLRLEVSSSKFQVSRKSTTGTSTRSGASTS